MGYDGFHPLERLLQWYISWASVSPAMVPGWTFLEGAVHPRLRTSDLAGYGTTVRGWSAGNARFAIFYRRDHLLLVEIRRRLRAISALTVQELRSCVGWYAGMDPSRLAVQQRRCFPITGGQPCMNDIAFVCCRARSRVVCRSGTLIEEVSAFLPSPRMCSHAWGRYIDW